MRPSRHDIWDHLDPGTPLAALIAITRTPNCEKMSSKKSNTLKVLKHIVQPILSKELFQNWQEP